MVLKNSNRKIWTNPWGYKEGLLVSISLLLVGFVLEIVTNGGGVNLISAPVNVYVGLFILAFLVVLHVFFRTKELVKWLSNVPAAVTSFSMVTFLVLLLGFTPQNDSEVPDFIRVIGLSHLTESWPFALAFFYFQIALGLVTLRRFNKITTKNIGFFLNHAGLWITITAGILGAGDLQRLRIYLNEGGDFNKIAYDSKDNAYNMPFSLSLIDFSIEEYPPKLFLYDVASGSAQIEEGTAFFEVKPNLAGKIFEWQIEVKKYFQYAVINKDTLWEERKINGACIAAYIVVNNTITGESTEGWINTQSNNYAWQPLILNDKFALGMSESTPKRFTSELEIKNYDNEVFSAILDVNKPIKIDGWKLYQQGYDSMKGRWSDVSIIEAVSDPWLPLVYIGIFMLIAGGIYLFLIGNNKKE